VKFKDIEGAQKASKCELVFDNPKIKIVYDVTNLADEDTKKEEGTSPKLQ